MYLLACACNNLADAFASKNIALISSTSIFEISSFPLVAASMFEGVKS